MSICSVEAVELLVASLFSDEAPLAPPSTGLAGFLRFLLLLAGHDWATAPLLVDPQGELSTADRAAAVEAFSRSRDSGELTIHLFERVGEIASSVRRHIVLLLLCVAFSECDCLVSLFLAGFISGASVWFFIMNNLFPKGSWAWWQRTVARSYIGATFLARTSTFRVGRHVNNQPRNDSLLMSKHTYPYRVPRHGMSAPYRP